MPGKESYDGNHTKNISLQPEDYIAVNQLAKAWGQSFSGSLRLIIREGHQFKR